MNMKFVNRLLLFSCVGALCLLMSCDDDPEAENIPELITQATLTFTPTGGSTGPAVVVTAVDPDLQGSQDLQVSGPINLKLGTTYQLSIELINELYEEDEEGYDVSEEVGGEEGDEHQLFFRFSTEVFSNPGGTGNIKDENNPSTTGLGNINYDDEDEEGRPVGLLTTWTTINDISASGKTFRVLLKHQPNPGGKSANSTSLTGEDDMDLTFTINVVQ
jgi:hypothetical protein